MAHNANPPQGTSVLFGAQSETAIFNSGVESGRSPKLTLKNIDQISWFTDRPDRETGHWSPRKLVREWDNLFGSLEPNAIAGFQSSKGKGMVAFEMFEPRWNQKNGNLSFKLTPLGRKQKDLITGLDQVKLNDISLFIDNTTASQPPWYPNGQNTNFTGVNFSGMNLSNAQLENSILSNVNFTGTNLTGANLLAAYGAGITGQNANFTNGVLWSANLENSNFSGATFAGANAQGVGFQNANLTSVNFSNAYLPQANFIGANLTGANFTGAQGIGSAQFYGATWGNTICPNGVLNSGSSPCPGATPYG